MVDHNNTALPADRATAAEPEVSALRDGIPSARCEHCIHYRAIWGTGWQGDRRSWQGDCRRYPPVITGDYRTAPDNSRTQRLGEWPMVEAGWSCGEYTTPTTPKDEAND